VCETTRQYLCFFFFFFFGMNSAKRAFCCFFVLLCVSVGLYGGSFETLDPLHVALSKNTVTGKVDTNQVYTPGRYFLGLANSFVKYPVTLQTVKFGAGGDGAPLRPATSGGVTVTLDMSFMFRLKVAEIGELYRAYETSYRNRFVSFAESRLKNELKRFSFEQYYTNRAVVEAAALAGLNAELNNEHAIVEHVQIRSVTAEARVEAPIVQKLVAQQENEKFEFERNATVIRASTRVISEEAEASKKVIEATAEATAKVLRDQASAQAIEIAANASAEAWGGMKTSIGFTNQQLLQHIWYDTLRGEDVTARFAINLPSLLVDAPQ
jgi:regulator of protease activity HflC (stomatin/prohibitin superfamily)